MARFSLSGVGVPVGRESHLAQQPLDPFVAYFETRAEATLPAPAPWPAASPADFERALLSPPRAAPVPIVGSVRLVDLDGDGHLEIVVADFGHGLLLAGDPVRRPGELRELAKVPNPTRFSAVDLDRDGVLDLLVADAGFFMPEDNTKGAVVWLRGRGDGSYEKRVLAEGLPRVADVRAADFDGDGDLDLAVAAFGLHSLGALLLLENQTEQWTQPLFATTTLDSRNGAVGLETADLDRDGRADLLVLFAQQHETLVMFLNRGGGRFEARPVWSAPTPAWGSTSLRLADLDGDADPDVVLTNGASLDDATVRPYHGVRWLENGGDLTWREHALANLPGAHEAAAADLDGDGDLDLAVSAFLPDTERSRGGFTSLGWLEQTRRGVFQPHALQAGQLSHTTVDAGDLDGDGRPEIVTGNFVGFTFARTGTGFRAEAWVEVWRRAGSAP